ncbi:Putative Zinc finger, BED-type [Arachis hypogaea]|nr:Putative Zinc finger, BED-type [Arachis hypogaea]
MSSSQTPSETPPSQEQASSATPTPNLTTKRVYNIRGKTDPAWKHCKQIVEKAEKVTMMCIYCDKPIKGGGINRFKYHLAGKRGDVEKCKKVLPAVAYQFGQNIEEFINKKRKTQENYAESYGACDEVEREFDRMKELEARQQQQHSRTRLPPPVARKGEKHIGIETFFSIFNNTWSPTNDKKCIAK